SKLCGSYVSSGLPESNLRTKPKRSCRTAVRPVIEWIVRQIRGHTSPHTHGRARLTVVEPHSCAGFEDAPRAAATRAYRPVTACRARGTCAGRCRSRLPSGLADGGRPR